MRQHHAASIAHSKKHLQLGLMTSGLDFIINLCSMHHILMARVEVVDLQPVALLLLAHLLRMLRLTCSDRVRTKGRDVGKVLFPDPHTITIAK
jgi:hypothetical protein